MGVTKQFGKYLKYLCDINEEEASVIVHKPHKNTTLANLGEKLKKRYLAAAAGILIFCSDPVPLSDQTRPFEKYA